MPLPDHAITWRTSSRTGGNDNCVEVADLPGAVGVRDTKNRSAGSLTVPKPLWRQLAQQIKAGDFDL